MNTKTTKKYTIIGGGLAGTVLALTFLEKGLDVNLINHTNENAASQVAAGLYNPVSFKRCIAVWQAKEQIGRLEKFYPFWQEKLKVDFYHPLKSKKIVPNAEYYNTWMGKSTQKAESQFLGEISSEVSTKYKEHPEEVNLAQVEHTGYVNVPQFICTAHEYLKTLGCLSQIDSPYYPNNVDEEIIYAEGVNITENPLFSYIPIVPTHGDILKIKSGINEDAILHFGKFLIPLGNSVYRFGSTYNWDIENTEPSEGGLHELTTHWKKHFSEDFKLLEHKAGLRPATKDRMPLLGQHPKYQNIHCFNGLGSKGVLMAPYLANILLDNIQNNTSIEKSINISRYQHLWKK